MRFWFADSEEESGASAETHSKRKRDREAKGVYIAQWAF